MKSTLSQKPEIDEEEERFVSEEEAKGPRNFS